MKFSLIAGATASIALAAFSSAAAAAEVPQYQYVFLDNYMTGDGHSTPHAVDLNNAGEAVAVFDEDGYTYTIRYSNGTKQMVNMPPPFANNVPFDMNDAGEISGAMSSKRNWSFEPSGYFWSKANGVARDLGHLVADYDVYPIAINTSRARPHTTPSCTARASARSS